MKLSTARFRTQQLSVQTTHISGGFLIIAVCIVLLAAFIVSPLHAQSTGRVTYEMADEEQSVRPYLIGYVGVGDPVDDAYGEVFSDPYFRVGGGFGMRFGRFGAEVLMRQGSVTETHVVPINLVDDEVRSFSYGTTEVQLRIFASPRFGKLIVPAGVGIGLVNVTVDRGYPGVFDRFGSGNFYVGPYAGVEYQVNNSFALGIEAEYALSTVNFGSSQAWQDQYSGNLQSSVGEGSFWDTVGGDESIDFNTSGVLVSLRAIIYIPTYRGEG